MSPWERWVPLALAVAKWGTPAAPAPTPLGMRGDGALRALALSCAAATMVLTLIAVGLAVAPELGVAGALGVEAGLTAALGLSALAFARFRATRPKPVSREIISDLPLIQIAALLKRNSGLSITAGLLLGALASGRRGPN